MAGNSIRVNTDQVAQIASSIESLNKRLTAELTDSKQTIDNLANIWEGEASRATITSFDEFAAKYFQNYEDILNQYVQFLRTNVDAGYFETETANIGLADAFKQFVLPSFDFLIIPCSPNTKFKLIPARISKELTKDITVVKQ